jgi:ABC-type transporter Mla MlaB component
VATYKILDRADEFRIEIIGRLTGEGVQQVRRSWEQALKETTPRRLSVDISGLSGYDSSGRNLLEKMYRHGTEFAARTPSSLVFLNEISSTPRASASLITTPITKPQRPSEPPLRAVASGQ